jgi:hypothetical protein
MLPCLQKKQWMSILSESEEKVKVIHKVKEKNHDVLQARDSVWV